MLVGTMSVGGLGVTTSTIRETRTQRSEKKKLLGTVCLEASGDYVSRIVFVSSSFCLSFVLCVIYSKLVFLFYCSNKTGSMVRLLYLLLVYC